MQSLRTKKHTYTHTNNFSFTWRLKSFEMHFSVLLLLSFSPSSYHKQKPTRHICNWQTHAADIVFHSFTVQRRYLVLYSLIHPLIHPSIHISMYPATTTPYTPPPPLPGPFERLTGWQKWAERVQWGQNKRCAGCLIAGEKLITLIITAVFRFRFGQTFCNVYNSATFIFYFILAVNKVVCFFF